MKRDENEMPIRGGVTTRLPDAARCYRGHGVRARLFLLPGSKPKSSG
ncbi:MAG: hypothetical protein R3338_10880 [Thermoanaerobaculia bacterium]|nr:hypothetical protein [Thermoanaerobaculia bacterium]